MIVARYSKRKAGRISGLLDDQLLCFSVVPVCSCSDGCGPSMADQIRRERQEDCSCKAGGPVRHSKGAQRAVVGSRAEGIAETGQRKGTVYKSGGLTKSGRKKSRPETGLLLINHLVHTDYGRSEPPTGLRSVSQILVFSSTFATPPAAEPLASLPAMAVSGTANASS